MKVGGRNLKGASKGRRMGVKEGNEEGGKRE